MVLVVMGCLMWDTEESVTLLKAMDIDVKGFMSPPPPHATGQASCFLSAGVLHVIILADTTGQALIPVSSQRWTVDKSQRHRKGIQIITVSFCTLYRPPYLSSKSPTDSVMDTTGLDASVWCNNHMMLSFFVVASLKYKRLLEDYAYWLPTTASW